MVFFRWVEDVRKINMSTEWEELQRKLLENEKIIPELEVENKILDEKVKKSKMKRDILEEPMQYMTNVLYQLCGSVCKYEIMKKYALVLFVMSWLIFVIVVMVMNYDSYDSE